MRLIITGATGLAGLNVYRAALEDPTVSAITLLMRREMPAWATLPANASEKTTTIIHTNFTSYEPDLAAQLAQHDACLWALGKSVRGMAEKEYTAVTHDYPIAMLNALREAGVGEGRAADQPFRFLYWSGERADPSGSSSMMWARVKGRAEAEIMDISKSTPGLRAHILRPGYIVPSRKFPQDLPNQRSRLESGADRILSPALSLLAPTRMITVEQMAKAALEIAKGHHPDTDLFRCKALLEVAKQG